MHRSTRRILTTHHLRRFEPAPSLPQFPRKQTLLLHIGISVQAIADSTDTSCARKASVRKRSDSPEPRRTDVNTSLFAGRARETQNSACSLVLAPGVDHRTRPCRGRVSQILRLREHPLCFICQQTAPSRECAAPKHLNIAPAVPGARP